MPEAKGRDCILVNANSVADDLVDPDVAESDAGDRIAAMVGEINGIPFVMPPFPSMWIEFLWRWRWAVQVQRLSGDDGKSSVALWVWMESNGTVAGPMCAAMFSLNEAGSIDQGAWRMRVLARTPNEGQNAVAQLQCFFAVGCAIHALGRMNCKNTELRPIRGGKLRPHPPNTLVRASVWHEIVITSVPKIRSTGKDVFEHEGREIRAHWIRGHYADYRKGAGLFGNPKLKTVFWIPEHRRGNEELGQVIPEYTVQ